MPFYAWMISNTLIAGSLALVVAAVCRWRRFGPAVRHALWLVVLIKLITPPLLDLPLPWPSLLRSQADVALGPVGGAGVTPDGRDGLAVVSDVLPEELPSFGSIADPFESTPVESVSIDSIAASSEGDSSIAEATRFVPIEETASVSESIGGEIRQANEAPAASTLSAWAGFESERAREFLAAYFDGSIFAPLPPWLVCGWWLGSGGVLFVQARRLLRLRRMIAGGRPADRELTDLVRQVADELDVGRLPVRIVPGLPSPALCAWGPVSLLWPDGVLEQLTPAGRRAVVLHELAHFKRRDHWVGWLELVAGCGWWWNPLYWYVRHHLQENAELACDAWVVALLPDGRRAFADALIDVAQGPELAPISGIVLGVGDGSRKLLERRLIMIMRGKTGYRIPAIGLVLIALVALVTLTHWSPGYAEPAGLSFDAPYDTETPEPATEVSADSADPFAQGATPELPQPAADASPFVVDDVPSGATLQLLSTSEPALDTPSVGVAEPQPEKAVLNPTAAVEPAAVPAVPGIPVAPPADQPGDAARLQKLEAQLAALLAEVQALRGTRPTAPVYTAGSGFKFTPTSRLPGKVSSDEERPALNSRPVPATQASSGTAPSKPKTPAPAGVSNKTETAAVPQTSRSVSAVELPVARSASAVETAVPAYRPAPGAKLAAQFSPQPPTATPGATVVPRTVVETHPDGSVSQRIVFESVVLGSPQVETITRAIYRLPAGRAEALAKFLEDQLSDEIDVKLKGDSLQVTASAEDQQAVARLIGLMQAKGRTERNRPSPSSSTRPRPGQDPKVQPVESIRRSQSSSLPAPVLQFDDGAA